MMYICSNQFCYNLTMTCMHVLICDMNSEIDVVFVIKIDWEDCAYRSSWIDVA